MNTLPRQGAPSAGNAPNLSRRAQVVRAPARRPGADLTDRYVARPSQTRPRVLIVTPQPFYEDRGTPIAVRYVASALGALNVDVHLLAFPVGRDIGMKNVTIHRCANALGIKQVPIGFSLRKLALDGGLWRSFSRLLAYRRFDVVHAVEEAAYMASVLCPPLAQRFIYDMASAIPTELMRNSAVKSALLRTPLEAVQRRVMHNASHIICSAGLASYVRAQAADARVDEWQYPALPSAVSTHDLNSLRSELKIHPGQHVLLYTGSFAGYQGLDLLLAAFARVSKQFPELVLVCVGASESDQARWSMAPDRQFDGSVRIVSRRPRSQMPLYMELADVLLLPRVGCQNVPLKLYDYMAAGKPIVATRQPGANRLLNEHRAFLCDATAESLADAIVRARSHPAQAAWIASQAMRYAEQHFGWRSFVEFVRHIYLQVIPPGE
ncbi:MAG TPA: glycosyltransferase family 4 protein, partial [Steroidobacteraceae bacterium]